MARHTTLGSLFSDIANAIRSKTGGSTPLTADNFDTEINSIVTDPSGPCTATNDTILAGYNAYAGGVLRDGGIPIKSANDVQVSGQSVFTPKGYYNADVTKSVASGSTALTAYANGYVYANRAAGYQAAGNPSVHYATKAGTTITPSAAQQTAIPANTLATGAIIVNAVDNVSAGNIKKGVSIAGVPGNAEGANFFSPFVIGQTRMDVFNGIAFANGIIQGNANWTCPPGVTEVTVSVFGGSGQTLLLRYSDVSEIRAYGGGGFIQSQTVQVVPGTVYSINFFAPASSSNWAAAHDGVAASFNNNQVLAMGGNGGRYYEANKTIQGGNGGCYGGGVNIIHNRAGVGYPYDFTLANGGNVRGGSAVIGGGGGVNLYITPEYQYLSSTVVDYRMNLIGGNGGKFGGGGGVYAYAQNFRNRATQHFSCTPGRGGFYGGNGGAYVYANATLNAASVVVNTQASNGTNLYNIVSNFVNLNNNIFGVQTGTRIALNPGSSYVNWNRFLTFEGQAWSREGGGGGGYGGGGRAQQGGGYMCYGSVNNSACCGGGVAGDVTGCGILYKGKPFAGRLSFLSGSESTSYSYTVDDYYQLKNQSISNPYSAGSSRGGVVIEYDGGINKYFDTNIVF